MSREATEQVLGMIEEGLLCKDIVIMACLKYMSEAEVKDMAISNDFFDEEDEPSD